MITIIEITPIIAINSLVATIVIFFVNCLFIEKAEYSIIGITIHYAIIFIILTLVQLIK